MILNGKHQTYGEGVFKNSFLQCKVHIHKNVYMPYACNVYHNHDKSLTSRREKKRLTFFRCHEIKIFPRVFLKYAILNNKIRVCEAKIVHVYMYVAYLHKNR